MSRSPCEEAPVVDGQVKFEVDHGDRLSDIIYFEATQLVQIVFDHLGNIEERLRTLPRCLVCPSGEGRVGRTHGSIQILHSTQRRGGHRFAGRRVDYFGRCAIR